MWLNWSQIAVIVRYWTTPRQPTVRQVQTRAIIAIKQAFDAADINIPYPIRTLYFYDQDRYDDYLPNNSDSDNKGNHFVKTGNSSQLNNY